MKLVPVADVEERFSAVAGLPVDPAAVHGAFTITLEFVGGLSESQKGLFREAALRWSRVITGDLPPETVGGRTVDDVLIQASGKSIDGVGGLLGLSGPTNVRHGTFLPFTSVMELDAADLNEMETDGRLEDVITHEMGHCLGIGLIWDDQGLVQGKNSIDPVFTGVRAQAEYGTLVGSGARPVPLENTGASVTRDGHWRERIFANEIMTGRISRSGNPISRMTVAALADMGYVVNMAAAEPFQMPSPSVFLEWHFSVELLQVERPRYKVASH